MPKSRRDKKIEAVEKRIVSVDEAEPYAKLVVYGRNGCGKTRFAATGPDVLIIDINEKGTRSARHSGAKVFHARKWEDIVYIYWYLREGNHKFESVAIDTVTQMQNLCMKQVLKEGADRDPNRDPKMPAQRDWGKLAEKMREQILNFRNLDMHVIFVCQERRIDSEDDETIEVTVDLSKANRATVLAAGGIIGRVYQREVRGASKKRKKEVKKWETRMLVGPHNEYITKDRTNLLGRIVRNPTMPNIIEAWREGGVDDEDEEEA